MTRISLQTKMQSLNKVVLIHFFATRQNPPFTGILYCKQRTYLNFALSELDTGATVLLGADSCCLLSKVAQAFSLWIFRSNNVITTSTAILPRQRRKKPRSHHLERQTRQLPKRNTPRMCRQQSRAHK